MSTEVVPVVPDSLSAVAIRAQVNLIQDVMKTVMIADTHYGVIPGTEKPTLLKPGAEKLCLTFRLDPQYESSEHFLGDHLFVRSKCTLYHQTTGRRMGSGEGSCSTKETKYAYRQGSRKCPNCGKEAIIKGKKEYGGGWLCFKKKDGCGAKWPEGAVEIESQSIERIANEDVADQYNTVLKMANKRSLIAAVLNVTAASDIFTQDVEDMPEFAGKKEETPATPSKPSVKPSEILKRSETVAGDGAGTGQLAKMQANTPPQQASDAPPPQISKPIYDPTQSLDAPQPSFIWRIGKDHKDESIATIPDAYLDWFVKNGKREDHVEAANLELDRRRGQGTMA